MAHSFRIRFSEPSVLPGLYWALGFSLLYMGVVVLLPLGGLLQGLFAMSWAEFWEIATAPRLMHAYAVSFGYSFLAAAINAVFGLILAWVLVRYEFPGKGLADAMVDLPFALPTAVAGIALAALYAPNGWIGQWLAKIGIQVAFTPLGILIAMVFIGLPFVVRTLQPVLEDADLEVEEAAAALGASRLQTWTKVILPSLSPALLTGFAMAFARALGEYGSIIFIAGNVPFVSEIVPLLIISKLEQFDYAGATAIAVVMLASSFVLLYVINQLQAWANIRSRKD
jgi:sulfate transport system permease protein